MQLQQISNQQLQLQYNLDESSGSGEEETEEGEANEGGKRMKGKYDERIEQLEKNIELKRSELRKEKGMAEEERQALATELRAKEVNSVVRFTSFY